jgi:uncharacterized protein YuzE
MQVVILKEAVNMRIKYSEDADILLITLRDGTPVDSVDMKAGIILHLDRDGLPLEIEILDAAKLSMLEEINVATSFGGKKTAHATYI